MSTPYHALVFMVVVGGICFEMGKSCIIILTFLSVDVHAFKLLGAPYFYCKQLTYFLASTLYLHLLDILKFPIKVT